MEKKILWNTLIDENVNLKIININRVKKKKIININNNNKSIKKKIINYSIENPEIIEKINKTLQFEDIENISSLELLKKQEFITNYLSRYFIQNTKLNYTFVISNVSWLIKVSKSLATRINQKLLTNLKNKKKNNNVSRSSYKFCMHNSQCEYNYGTKKRSCNSDHYVHSNIYSDLRSLEQYIKTKTE